MVSVLYCFLLGSAWQFSEVVLRGELPILVLFRVEPQPSPV